MFEILVEGCVYGLGDGLTRQSPRWGQVGPLTHVLGAEVTVGVPELELPP